MSTIAPQPVTFTLSTPDPDPFVGTAEPDPVVFILGINTRNERLATAFTLSTPDPSLVLNLRPDPVTFTLDASLAPVVEDWSNAIRPREYYSQSREGLLYAATGWGPVRRWDGLVSTGWEEAGVPAPDAAPSFGVETTPLGWMSGSYVAYYRWVDRYGNVGNPSPESIRVEIADVSGPIDAVSGATPIRITSPAHSLADGGRTDISGTTLGSRILLRWPSGHEEQLYYDVIDANTFDLYEDSELSTGAAPLSYRTAGGEWTQNVSGFYYGITKSIPPAVVAVQLLRNRSGSEAAVYVDVEEDTADLTTPEGFVTDQYFVTSSNEDGALGEELVLIDPFTGDASYALRFGLPPNDKPYLAVVGGRMIAAGDPVWTRGTVNVVNGSVTVTGVDAGWSGDFTDRKLYIGTKSYPIASYSVENQTLTIPAYDGPTANGITYAIGPSYRQRRFIQWSEAGYPEGWNPLSSINLPSDSEGGQVTGLCSFENSALVFCESRTFRFAFALDPARDGDVQPAYDRGCLNNRCWIRTDESVFALDRRGVYRTDGRTATPLSDAIQDIFGGHDETWNIDWSYADDFHGCFDAANDSLLFFVSLEADSPRYILAYRMKSDAWEILEYPIPLLASSPARIENRQRVICGTDYGQVIVLDEGLRDGAESGTLSGTATSATATTLSDTSATFEAAILHAPLFIISGTGKGQWRRITVVAATQLTVESDWDTTPDATSRYVVGGITWQWRSGWYRWVESERHEKPRAAALTFEPTAVASRLALHLYADQSDTPLDQKVDRKYFGITTAKGDPDLLVDVTKTNGYVRYEMPGQSENSADGWRRIGVGMEGTTNGDQHSVFQLDIEGAEG